MDIKLFKNFYVIRNAALHPWMPAWNDVDVSAYDPAGQQWRSIGIGSFYTDGAAVIELDGGQRLLLVQINERNLPGSVIREKLAERLKGYEAETGRKPGKKLKAELRDEIELDLLPKAFIRRKYIPVIFDKEWIYVFTSSVKVRDDVLSLLAHEAPSETMAMQELQHIVEKPVDMTLTTIASDSSAYYGDIDEPGFEVGATITLKGGENQSVISIKDKDVGSHDVQELLKQDYTVTRLALAHINSPIESGEADATFILNTSLLFARFAAIGIDNTRSKDASDAADTFMANLWLLMTAITMVRKTTVAVFGGLRAEPVPKEDKRIAVPVSTSDDEDDEL